MRVDENDVEFHAIRAQGAGGQNVNKVSSAIHLRFDIRRSALPDALKTRLLASSDSRISREGILVIKAQTFRSQEKNRADALRRLEEMVAASAHLPRKRRATKPSRAAKARRTDHKTKRGKLKALRGKVSDD